MTQKLYDRTLDPLRHRTSAFLFGPRMTGKTTILQGLPHEVYFDLLDPDQELRFRSTPRLFWEQVSALEEGSTVVVDEIQRVPELLNYVQMGMDRMGHVFLLSGSSARKLRRGGANLLGGRALELHLHPLTVDEIGDGFSLDRALALGTIPKIHAMSADGRDDTARAHLSSYVTTYIKQEVQAEALTRNIGAFQRFLTIAGQDNAQVIEFANVSRESSVPSSTVKEYYQILEDTLLGFFLWPYAHSERKKARGKFYFFDCGVVRSIQNRLQDRPTPQELGFLFETWFIGELRRIRDYLDKPHDFSFWRERNSEIDILITKGDEILLAVECKSGVSSFNRSSLRAFRNRFPGVKTVVASRNDQRPRRTDDNIDILPWHQVLSLYRAM